VEARIHTLSRSVSSICCGTWSTINHPLIETINHPCRGAFATGSLLLRMYYIVTLRGALCAQVPENSIMAISVYYREVRPGKPLRNTGNLVHSTIMDVCICYKRMQKITSSTLRLSTSRLYATLPSRCASWRSSSSTVSSASPRVASWTWWSSARDSDRCARPAPLNSLG
jgi:hypothetical protein